ncbi:TPA: hypothetical protein ACG0BA_004007 [Serratia odorifera]
MKFSKNSVAVLLLSLGVVGSASAVTVGTPVEASATLVVKAPATVVHTLLSSANNIQTGAIPSGTVVANGTIAITPEDSSFPMRIKDSTAQKPDEGYAVNSTDTTKKIKVKMVPGTHSAVINEEGWMRVISAGSQPNMTYQIVTDGESNVEDAGTYKITTEATTWTQ